MAQHSPAPWRTAWDGERQADLVVVDANNRAVCLVAQHSRQDSRTMANASMLAAAPKLLEACQILVEHIDMHPKALLAIGPGNVDIARAAIAAAQPE